MPDKKIKKKVKKVKRKFVNRFEPRKKKAKKDTKPKSKYPRVSKVRGMKAADRVKRLKESGKREGRTGKADDYQASNWGSGSPNSTRAQDKRELELLQLWDEKKVPRATRRKIGTKYYSSGERKDESRSHHPEKKYDEKLSPSAQRALREREKAREKRGVEMGEKWGRGAGVKVKKVKK